MAHSTSPPPSDEKSRSGYSSASSKKRKVCTPGFCIRTTSAVSTRVTPLANFPHSELLAPGAQASRRAGLSRDRTFPRPPTPASGSARHGRCRRARKGMRPCARQRPRRARFRVSRSFRPPVLILQVARCVVPPNLPLHRTPPRCLLSRATSGGWTAAPANGRLGGLGASRPHIPPPCPSVNFTHG